MLIRQGNLKGRNQLGSTRRQPQKFSRDGLVTGTEVAVSRFLRGRFGKVFARMEGGKLEWGNCFAAMRTPDVFGRIYFVRDLGRGK